MFFDPRVWFRCCISQDFLEIYSDIIYILSISDEEESKEKSLATIYWSFQKTIGFKWRILE